MSPVFPYPIMGEIQKKAASGYYSPKFFNSRVRKMLKTIFGYRGPGPAEKNKDSESNRENT